MSPVSEESEDQPIVVQQYVDRDDSSLDDHNLKGEANRPVSILETGGLDLNEDEFNYDQPNLPMNNRQTYDYDAYYESRLSE